MTQQDRIRVGVCGAAGRMGKEVVKTVLAQPDMELVMAIDTHDVGHDAGLTAGNAEPAGVHLESDLEAALKRIKPQVMVDFTAPDAVLSDTLIAVKAGVRVVIGTTGLTPQGSKEIEAELKAHGGAVMVVPNFAIGAVLLMKFAKEASKYFEHAEIIELHHNKKIDAPSGTAFRTAALMEESRAQFGITNIPKEEEKEILLGSRGGETDKGIRIHSVRLPGLVAHQEVLFGGLGQTLTIRHDSLDRTSFMPGVALAVRKIVDRTGLLYGLEQVMD